MPYQHKNSKGQAYYLHAKTVKLQNGREQRIHYFAREPKQPDVVDQIPAGYKVEENTRTGLPFLKKAA